jgi:thiosulfate/3-mercaptopyruvate sulfurtransferase
MGAMKPLVTCGWLASHLGDLDLRVLDCSVVFGVTEQGGFTISPALDDWKAGHIPGSMLADLVGDLSDDTSDIPLMMAPPQQFAGAMGQYGVGQGTRVVLYDRAFNMWAARVWWMLRAYGFDDAAVLSGGWRKWTLEGREASTDPSEYPPAAFEPHPRPELMATKDEVQAAIESGATCLINALPEAEHSGEVQRYARAGHIPSSFNIPSRALLDPNTQEYLALEEIRRLVEPTGALERERVITYCGGGVAASGDAFVLTLLGHTNVAVYDASLLEWAADASLPMATGE